MPRSCWFALLALWRFCITGVPSSLAPSGVLDRTSLPLARSMPVVIGYLVGLAQVAGGLAVLTGILTRVGAACVALVMLGAIILVHLPHGFDVSRGGMEYALTELLLAIALIFTGPGAYSLSSWLPVSLRKL